jgi:hypothetical protein
VACSTGCHLCPEIFTWWGCQIWMGVRHRSRLLNYWVTTYRIWWVNIGTSTWVPLECIHFYLKVPKTATKSFWVKWPFEER